MRDLAQPNRRANDVPGINELSPRPLGWRNPSTGCADHPPGPLTTEYLAPIAEATMYATHDGPAISLRPGIADRRGTRLP
jgi:hypothetical protein